ncbi:MAG: DUF488 domain-containing protein [Candidatus Obscuribacterales bacterium]|nr:DUF488 domain-containing protein [Candidatus Obscuribacterales bacterium]
MIRTKRVYDEPEPTDGLRILVDRLWPRGISKEKLVVDDWIKEVSPSTELRQWFAHKPERWRQFLIKYFQELDHNQVYWQPLLKKAQRHHMTLIYAAKDVRHNNAEALKQYLEAKLPGRASNA